jgi:hypothetical protein
MKSKLENKKNVLDIVNQNLIGESLLKIYKEFKNYDSKMNNKDWTIYSANYIKEYENKFGNKMIIIGSRYLGMGWYAKISYIPETDNFCFITDGVNGDENCINNLEYYRSNKYIPANLQLYNTLSEEEAKLCVNIKTIKYCDHKIRLIQYTYDNLIELDFFKDMKIKN